MYGKIFASIYDGSLYGHWQAIVTMQQLIVLAGPDGVVDMTPQAIAARTSIPLDVILAGIEALEAPDQYSRTPDQGGRRIERIDAHRPWGWRLVNHAKYRWMVSAEQKRESDRLRIAAKRAAQAAQKPAPTLDVANSRKVSRASQKVVNVAQAEAEAEAEAKKEIPKTSKSPASTEKPAVAKLPLSDGSEAEIVADQVAEWSAAFPGVNVAMELAQMRTWLIASPDRRKTRKGIFRFVVSWLGREQDRPKPKLDQQGAKPTGKYESMPWLSPNAL